jgi:hypothetical protein
MTATSGWICKVCWKWNRPQDAACYKCKSPQGLTDDSQVAEQRKVLEAKAAEPEPVPDLVVAVPVWVYRGYARVWLRGGMGLLGLLALMAFGGVTDLVWYGLTAGFAVCLIVGGFMAGEVAEGMRNREIWAFVVGIALAIVGVIGSITAFSVFAPDVNLNAVRWGSVLIFGGAGIAAGVGVVMLVRASRAAAR